jgi:Lon protease-like protein
VFPIGCSGVMTHVERLADGRFNIVLRGLERFRIVQEDHARSYRRAIVEPLHERELGADDRGAVLRQRSKLEAMLAPGGDRRSTLSGAAGLGAAAAGADPRIPATMNDADLVNTLAQYLDFEPLEKQALLEHNSLRARAESLVELLEMKVLMARTPGLSNVAHGRDGAVCGVSAPCSLVLSASKVVRLRRRMLFRSS